MSTVQESKTLTPALNTQGERRAAMLAFGGAARAASAGLSASSGEARNAFLREAAAGLRRSSEAILAANARDMAAAVHLPPPKRDRLLLNDERLEAMAQALEEVIALPDPLGRILARWQAANGLDIARVAVPLGVIGIIYESRPEVTAHAAGLAVKSGNAAILRASSDSAGSAAAISLCLADALGQAGLPEAALTLVPAAYGRAAVDDMLGGLDGNLDVIIPRGGIGLLAHVKEHARVPVFGHMAGLCHVYVHHDADLAMAQNLIVNAKMRRTGICGAAETLLVDRAAAGTHLPALLRALAEAGCSLRGDEAAQKADARVAPAGEEDWRREYLDAVISVRLVDGLEGALAHLARYGSGHTEAIITASDKTAAAFMAGADSAIIMHNASTQYADGGEFGMGAEIGIATGKFHARGPVGLEQLTSFKYLVRGKGHCRP